METFLSKAVEVAFVRKEAVHHVVRYAALGSFGHGDILAAQMEICDMPKHADGPKTPPQIVRFDQLTQLGEQPPTTNEWKKTKKLGDKAKKAAIEQQRAARLARDKNR